jgi:peptide chain release factor 2
MQNLYKSDIAELKKNIEDTIQDLNLEDKKKELEDLKENSLNQDFWKDADTARKTMSKIDTLQKEVESANNLLQDCNDLLELFDMASENEKDSFSKEFAKLKKDFESFTKYKFLSGKYDKSGAILSVHAGQGGTEAQDWAEMLLRMYTRYCERQGWKYEILHSVPGTEAGISSVSIEIDGPYAYGYLRKETGTHRLVRLSPFNAQNLRQTSFAGVEVIPIVEDEEEIKIDENEIDFKAVRSGGPGGQSVNKTSSAVIITHKPTGITVQCSEGRDQFQNKKKALQILKSKLWLLEEEKRQKNLQNLKGEHKIAGWGNQIRNYILHPYKLVKDLRTNIEYSNPEEILDGNLDIFLEALVRI